MARKRPYTHRTIRLQRAERRAQRQTSFRRGLARREPRLLGGSDCRTFARRRPGQQPRVCFPPTADVPRSEFGIAEPLEQ